MMVTRSTGDAGKLLLLIARAKVQRNPISPEHATMMNESTTFDFRGSGIDHESNTRHGKQGGSEGWFLLRTRHRLPGFPPSPSTTHQLCSDGGGSLCGLRDNVVGGPVSTVAMSVGPREFTATLFHGSDVSKLTICAVCEQWKRAACYTAVSLNGQKSLGWLGFGACLWLQNGCAGLLSCC